MYSYPLAYVHDRCMVVNEALLQLAISSRASHIFSAGYHGISSELSTANDCHGVRALLSQLYCWPDVAHIARDQIFRVLNLSPSRFITTHLRPAVARSRKSLPQLSRMWASLSPSLPCYKTGTHAALLNSGQHK